MSPPRILIAQHDPLLRHTLAAALVREPLEVESASDAREAMTQIAQSRYTLVLLDLRMPRMSGFEVLEWLRSREERPIIFIMGAPQATPHRVDPALVQAVIHTPSDLDGLVEIVRETALLWESLISSA